MLWWPHINCLYQKSAEMHVTLLNSIYFNWKHKIKNKLFWEWLHFKAADLASIWTTWVLRPIVFHWIKLTNFFIEFPTRRQRFVLEIFNSTIAFSRCVFHILFHNMYYKYIHIQVLIVSSKYKYFLSLVVLVVSISIFIILFPLSGYRDTSLQYNRWRC